MPRLSARLVDYHERSPFLGIGAQARVFRVLAKVPPLQFRPDDQSEPEYGTAGQVPAPPQEQECAFKLLIEDPMELHLEVERLRIIWSKWRILPEICSLIPRLASEVVLEITEPSQITGAAVLLHPVGKPVVDQERKISLQLFCDICTSLRQLHSNGIVHGDARLPNVMRATMPYVKSVAGGRHVIEYPEDQLMWIDLYQSRLIDVDATASWEERLQGISNCSWRDWQSCSHRAFVICLSKTAGLSPIKPRHLHLRWTSSLTSLRLFGPCITPDSFRQRYGSDPFARLIRHQL